MVIGAPGSCPVWMAWLGSSSRNEPWPFLARKVSCKGPWAREATGEWPALSFSFSRPAGVTKEVPFLQGQPPSPDPSALVELQKVFSPEMAYVALVPFSCLLGETPVPPSSPPRSCSSSVLRPAREGGWASPSVRLQESSQGFFAIIPPSLPPMLGSFALGAKLSSYSIVFSPPGR